VLRKRPSDTDAADQDSQADEEERRALSLLARNFLCSWPRRFA